MRWIASFGIALLTSIAAMFGAGTVAGLAVDWYNVSSFEGGAGFFVVGMALVGLIAVALRDRTLDVLVERSNFVPLPHRGDLAPGRPANLRATPCNLAARLCATRSSISWLAISVASGYPKTPATFAGASASAAKR